MAKHVEGAVPGSAGGSVYWQSWTPDDIKAVVVISHGLAEHSGRYAHVAARLNDAGYAVYALDHRGHGRTDGTAGNVEGFTHLRRDLDNLLTKARGEHPGLPVFLLGHSFGGLVALDFLIDRGESGVTGLVLSGPYIDAEAGNAVQRRLAPLLAALAPNAGVATLDATTVSRDPAEVARYVEDPLNYHGKVRARSGAEMLAAAGRVVSGVSRLTLPVLIMHGAADRLAPPGGSKLVAERIRSTDKTLTLYDGLFHEIFNEPEKDQVLGDVVTWLDKHI
ncbi:MAG TPA: lysophospholipase [Mycobacteriales bacterium]|nr:lysophospholipase [Mycobacteriales bacterium]